MDWYSSVDAHIGTGEALNAPVLSPGSHPIELRAADSAGALGSAWVGITVLPSGAIWGRRRPGPLLYGWP